MDLYRLGKGDIYEATTKGSETNGYLVQISNHNLVAYKKARSIILIRICALIWLCVSIYNLVHRLENNPH